MLGALSFFPFLACLWRGQDSILVLSLWALAYRAWKQGRDVRAGVFLGLSFIKFHLAYLFLVPLLLEKRSRALFGVGISAGILILTSALWIGVEGTLGYVEVLGSMATTLGKMANPQGKMQSWEAQLYLLGLEGVHSIPGRIMIAVIGMGLSVLLWKGRWQPSARDFELRFSAQVLLALLASPHCHIYDLSLVFLPAVFVLRHLLDQTDGSSSIADLACGASTYFTSGLGADIVGVGIRPHSDECRLDDGMPSSDLASCQLEIDQNRCDSRQFGGAVRRLPSIIL